MTGSALGADCLDLLEERRLDRRRETGRALPMAAVVAARAGGFHYSFDAPNNRWINDQGGEELFAQLSRLVTQQAGVNVSLA